MDNLGGASFKVTADPSSFMSAMDNAEKKATAATIKIHKEVVSAANAIELATDAEVRAAGAYTSALDREVAAAVEATQAQKLMRQALDETAIVQAKVAAETAHANTAAMRSSVAVAGAGNASRTSALGFLYLSQAIEDAQYGFSAIVNNIPMMVMAFGGGPGLAGAVSVLAVGANIALNHWESFSRALRSGAEQEAAANMDVLAEKAEKAAKAFEHLKEARTTKEEQSGKAFGEGVSGAKGGAELFQKQLAEAMTASGTAPSIEIGFTEAAKMAGMTVLNKIIGGGNSAEYIKEQLDKKQGEATTGEAGRLLGALAQGDESARDKVRVLIKKNPNAFSPELRKAFEESDPVAQEAIKQKQLEAQGARNNRKMEEKLAAEALDEKHQQAEWEKQGRKNDRDMVKKLDAEAKQGRIQALEGQRAAMVEQHHQKDLRLQVAKERLGQGSQTLSGPKAVSDFYQKAAADSPLVELAKATKAIQEQQRDELKQINDKLAKERAVRPS